MKTRTQAPQITVEEALMVGYRLDVSIPITINAVDVYTDTDGDRTIVVWDEGGNVVQSQSFYIQSTNGGSDSNNRSFKL